MIYIFALGRMFPLCLAELESRLRFQKINYKILLQVENHVVIDAENKVDLDLIVRQSGGIIKAGELFFTTPILSSDLKIPQIPEATEKKYKNFGLSLVGFTTNLPALCEGFKKQLNLHYILPKDGRQMSSAQITNKNVFELIIVQNNGQYQIFHTICVQDINHWTAKDEGRPHIDDRLGMLPLKVARIMINLAETKGILLDPFCGMGSILEEAIDLGFKQIVGGDINSAVCRKCEENIQWFKSKFGYETVSSKIILTDAAKISQSLEGNVDLIVTEPFLGDAHKLQRIHEYTNTRIRSDKEKNIKNIIKGLEKMYLGCLKDWRQILHAGSKVVIIVPEFAISSRTVSFNFLEICEKSGYNIIHGPYEYYREGAVVRRKIYVLKVKSQT